MQDVKNRQPEQLPSFDFWLHPKKGSIIFEKILRNKTMTTGTIFNIQRFAVNDGPGIRTTVFFKGCPLRCSWCHNPESQTAAPQLLFFENRCIRCGVCAAVCPQDAIEAIEGMHIDEQKCTVCGTCIDSCAGDARHIAGEKMNIAEVMTEIKKDSAFYQNSAGGVTFSGGEPLAQIDFLEALANECKRQGIHIALDTCGHAPWPLLQATLAWADLYLYDIKIMDKERHIQHAGVSNSLILDNLQNLAAAGATIIVRVPLIPGVTDDDENISHIIELVRQLKLPRVDLLPLHNTAASKYERIGKRYEFSTLHQSAATRTTEIRKKFESANIAVTIGG